MTFKETLIYAMEKDQPFKGISQFREYIFKKYKLIGSTELYRNITNYQISKYGKQLVNVADLPTYEEKQKLKGYKRHKKYMRGLKNEIK